MIPQHQSPNRASFTGGKHYKVSTRVQKPHNVVTETSQNNLAEKELTKDIGQVDAREFKIESQKREMENITPNVNQQGTEILITEVSQSSNFNGAPDISIKRDNLKLKQSFNRLVPHISNSPRQSQQIPNEATQKINLANHSPAKKRSSLNESLYKSVKKMNINSTEKETSDLNLTPCFKQKTPVKVEQTDDEPEALHVYKQTSNFRRAVPRSISNNVSGFDAALGKSNFSVNPEVMALSHASDNGNKTDHTQDNECASSRQIPKGEIKNDAYLNIQKDYKKPDSRAISIEFGPKDGEKLLLKPPLVAARKMVRKTKSNNVRPDEKVDNYSAKER